MTLHVWKSRRCTERSATTNIGNRSSSICSAGPKRYRRRFFSTHPQSKDGRLLEHICLFRFYLLHIFYIVNISYTFRTINKDLLRDPERKQNPLCSKTLTHNKLNKKSHLEIIFKLDQCTNYTNDMLKTISGPMIEIETSNCSILYQVK